jgi:hypothetical protein
VRDRGLLSGFYRWISSFPKPFVEETANADFWSFCQESDGCNCAGLFLELLFYCIDLHVYFLCQYHAVFITMAL